MVEIFRWAAAAAMLTGIVAVFRLWVHLNTTTAALTMLLLVLFLAARWGLRYALATSIAATVAYNYFFLRRLERLTINDPQVWLNIFAFLTVAIVGSRLSERVREEGADARRRQGELEVLYGLSRQLLQTENVPSLLNAISPAIMLVTRAEAILLYLLDGDRRYMAGDVSLIPLDDIALRQLAETLPAPETVAKQARIPLRVGVRPRGLLMINGVNLSVETLEAIGGLISASIDRAQALEDVTRGEAAKESERLRSLMIDSITHELRTPLTAIKAAASTLLLPDPLDPAEQRELLTVINEESDRLNQLVAEAVEMAQLDTREVHMTFAATSIESLVEKALTHCSSLLDKHEVKVNIPELPAVKADADYITKVLTNLIENAAKYSAEGTPICVSAELKDGMVSVSVADRGMGVDLSEQALIFERFYRANVPSQQSWGTGMGLAISRAIIEAHQGTLSVTSQLGEGSVFSFTLPVA
ncbi:MAG: sensor histidine kinase [Acidobacteriaceae bacterium]